MIIGICGLQGSGKDSIGSYLIKNHGFVKLSFAGVIKDIAAIIFDWDRELLEGSTKESREWREKIDTWWEQKLGIKNFTPRYVLQNFGTDLFRNHFHPDIWVRVVERQLLKYKNVVITDCRFSNEIKMIREAGGLIINVTRGDLPTWYIDYKNNKITKPENIHPSEYVWIKESFDYEILNNGSLEDLYTKTKNTINLN